MKRRLLVIIAALVVATAALPYAQVMSAPAANMQVGFAFTAGSKDMPAGKYSLEFRSADNGSIVLKGGGEAVILLPVTRLGRHDRDADPELVFDKTGGKLTLSEVWFPGMDGFLLVTTKAPHEHAVVGGSNPRN